jgi:uncharacterized membrane protein
MLLPVWIADVPALLAQAMEIPARAGADPDIFHPPTDADNVVQIILRWFHFVAGIIWIGHLYFFNLVNVNTMKALDPATRGKVVPQLMPRALWWFRWGAVVTVLVGLTYFAMYQLAPDVRNANSLGGANANTWLIFFVWLLLVVVTFAIVFFAIKNVNNGWALAAIVGVVVSAMAVAVVYYLNSALSGPQESYASNKTLSIGIGGGLGVIMLLNVWGIIWPNQKRIIAWTYDNAERGTAVPAASAKLARVAFLASRANTWLSIPMLFFMAASGHYLMFGK